MFNWPWTKSSEPTMAQQIAERINSEAQEETKTPRYNGIAPKERHDQIEFAFTSGGVSYFKFSADVNITFQRAIAAKDILTEELWQINPDYLKGWNEGLIALCLDGQKKQDRKLYEIGVLASRLKEQMELSFSLSRQMKLATVLYFDEAENPLDYQYPYNAEKIKHWTKHNDVEGFFLRMPEYALMPSMTELTKNFPTYLQTETQSQLNDLKHIISLTSLGNTDNDLRTALDLQTAFLSDLNTWSRGLSTNII